MYLFILSEHCLSHSLANTYDRTIHNGHLTDHRQGICMIENVNMMRQWVRQMKNDSLPVSTIQSAILAYRILLYNERALSENSHIITKQVYMWDESFMPGAMLPYCVYSQAICIRHKISPMAAPIHGFLVWNGNFMFCAFSTPIT